MPGLAMEPYQGSQPFLKYEKDSGLGAKVFDVEVQEDDDDGLLYRPRPQLSKSSVVMRPLKWLLKHMEAGYIDVDPEYQREVVWTADRMSGLVNSFMENYYIPPIILSKHHAEDNKHTMVCVDGKQRLSSVRAFIQGLIPCNDHRGEKWWFCDKSTSGKRKVLSETIKAQFLQKEFVSFEFDHLSPEQEEDLFARVQMGVQLSHAEKMSASTGPWQELARLYVDDFPTIFSLLKDRTRAKDFQLALSCFGQVVEVQHPIMANGVPSLKTSHLHLPKLLKNRDAMDDAFKSLLASTFITLKNLIEEDSDVFTNADKRLRGVQTFAPIEMVAVTVLISQYSESRNNRLLLGDITGLREHLREHFTDLRMNHIVWKRCWEYISNLERIRGAVNGTTIDRNKKEVARDGSPVLQEEPAIIASPVVKEGRPTERTRPVNVKDNSKPATVISRPQPCPASKPTQVDVGEVSAVLPTNTNPRKRQRVDHNNLRGVQILDPTQVVGSRAGASIAVLMVLDDSSPLTAPLPRKDFTPISTATIPKAQKARRSQAPLAVGASVPSPGSGRSLTELDPAQARKNRIAGNRARIATSMATPAATTVLTATETSRSLLNSTPSRAGSSIRKQPKATNPAAPAMQEQLTLPIPRRKRVMPSLPQIDGAIDLTYDTEQERLIDDTEQERLIDDTEQERQSLLMKFGASKKSKPNMNETGHGGCGSAEVEYISADELPPNPRKRRAAPCRSGPRGFCKGFRR